jgi:hypothetical protein
VEDVEYGIDLGLVGQRVHYADEASVSGQAVSTGAMAQGQRRRWEGGRVALLRSRVLGLLSAFIRYRSRLCLDLALDLLVPPLSSIALNVAAFGLVASIAHWRDPGLVVILWTATACASVLVLYVLRAWHLSGTGIRGMMDLARVPVFVVWKLVVMRGRHSGEWVRTERQRP